MVKLVLCLILFVAGTIRSEVSEDVLIDEVPVEPEYVDDISPLNSMVETKFVPSVCHINF